METYYASLFPDFDFNDPKSGMSDKTGRVKKRMIMNMDVFVPETFEGVENFPKVASYSGEIPSGFCSFSDRKSAGFHSGIHFYVDDYRFSSVWNRPLDVVRCLKGLRCPVIAPDFSLFVDAPRAVNVTQLYQNRWTSSYWQHEGIPVIPSASWGAVDSFSYCFDGLPEHSVISIGHVAVGRSAAEKQLYRLAVKELVIRKHPVMLIVYGAPLDFDPGVEVTNIQGFIETKLRKL